MRRLVLLTLLVAATVLVAPNPALAMGSPKIAALQAALWQSGLYHGDLSGVMNRATVRAVKRLQRSAGLAADGVVGPIGGVQEKIASAARDQATVFIMPKDNCAGVREVPSGMRLVTVATVSEAIAALHSLNDPATSAGVPGC